MARRAEDEEALVAALKSGDESAFAQLVDLHTPAMLRVACGYVPSREIAEEVVHETWIALLKGIGSFEGRSSLRTWLFTVLINIAKRRGVRERLRLSGRPEQPDDSGDLDDGLRRRGLLVAAQRLNSRIASSVTGVKGELIDDQFVKAIVRGVLGVVSPPPSVRRRP